MKKLYKFPKSPPDLGRLEKEDMRRAAAAAGSAAHHTRPVIQRHPSEIYFDARSGEQYQFDADGYIPYQVPIL